MRYVAPRESLQRALPKAVRALCRDDRRRLCRTGRADVVILCFFLSKKEVGYGAKPHDLRASEPPKEAM